MLSDVQDVCVHLHSDIFVVTCLISFSSGFSCWPRR